MNTALTFIGWVGWCTIIAFTLGGAYLLWVALASTTEPPTDPKLAKCDECGWVEGTNDDCDTCQRSRT